MKTKKRVKTGGRKKGTPNKVTTDLRTQISELIDNNFENIQSDIDNLEPKERLDFLGKLFEYSLPKLNRTEIDTNISLLENREPFNIRDIYKFEGDDTSGHKQKNLLSFENNHVLNKHDIT